MIDGDTAKYLAEKLGEATSGAGIPALVLVILTLVVTNKPTACIYAGLAGSLFLPAVNLLRRRSSIPELHHHLLAPADEIVYVIISLIVGFLIGAAGYAIKRQLIRRKIDLMLRPPAREDERSPPVGPTKSDTVWGLIFLGLFVGFLLWQQGAGDYIFSVRQTLRCEGAQNTTGTVNLVITTGWFTTPTISLHANNSVYSFDIVEASAARYFAKDRLKDNAAGTLNIDRLSGRLRWQWSTFQKGPPMADPLCFVDGIAPEYCESYMKETQTRIENIYTCLAAAPKF